MCFLFAAPGIQVVFNICLGYRIDGGDTFLITWIENFWNFSYFRIRPSEPDLCIWKHKSRIKKTIFVFVFVFVLNSLKSEVTKRFCELQTTQDCLLLWAWLWLLQRSHPMNGKEDIVGDSPEIYSLPNQPSPISLSRRRRKERAYWEPGLWSVCDFIFLPSSLPHTSDALLKAFLPSCCAGSCQRPQLALCS